MVIYVISNSLNFAIYKESNPLGFIKNLLVKICMCIWPWRHIFFFIKKKIPAFIFCVCLIAVECCVYI